MELQASAWWMRSRLTPQHQAEAWSSIYDRIIFLMFISLPCKLKFALLENIKKIVTISTLLDLKTSRFALKGRGNTAWGFIPRNTASHRCALKGRRSLFPAVETAVCTPLPFQGKENEM